MKYKVEMDYELFKGFLFLSLTLGITSFFTSLYLIGNKNQFWTLPFITFIFFFIFGSIMLKEVIRCYQGIRRLLEEGKFR